MNKNWLRFILLLLITKANIVFAQIESTTDTVPNSYFVTYSKAEYMQKLAALPCGIKESDAVKTVLQKLSGYLKSFVPGERFTDDKYAKASSLQALKSVLEGGYGIGAVLIDSNGNILEAAHNNQLQLHRSDLHGEMSLLTQFEQKKYAAKYMNAYVYKPGLIVFSSAEPCPMCFIRLATVGVNTLYCTPGPDDGMVSRVSCLPPSWADLAAKHSFKKGNCSPVMQKIAHLLFFSFLLDGRGPKG